MNVAVRVNLTSTSIDVDEDDPGSVVCVALEGALARNISATVMVGAKEDATDPATGEVHAWKHIHKLTQYRCMHNVYTHMLSRHIIYTHTPSVDTHAHSILKVVS